jgi:hypothetical protein
LTAGSVKRFTEGGVKRFTSRAGRVKGDMRTDIHQHVWPPELVEALRRRRRAPRLVGWTLHLDGEAPYEVDPRAHDASARAAAEDATGIDRALVSLSSPLGIESLPPADAAPLLAAWHAGADGLPDRFGVWAAVGLVEPDPVELKAVLDSDRVVGLQLPATTLADPAGIERLGPLLEALAEADRPLLVHPGPVAESCPGTPAWWPAVVPYVAQLHAAWACWHAVGRAAHPRLRIAFVALAGLAPLHHERLSARGGSLGRIDPLTWYETSSYGPTAIDAALRVVGVDALVNGSDRPYADSRDARLGPALDHAMHVANPHHLITGRRPPPPPGAGAGAAAAPRATGAPQIPAVPHLLTSGRR